MSWFLHTRKTARIICNKSSQAVFGINLMINGVNSPQPAISAGAALISEISSPPPPEHGTSPNKYWKVKNTVPLMDGHDLFSNLLENIFQYIFIKYLTRTYRLRSGRKNTELQNHPTLKLYYVDIRNIFSVFCILSLLHIVKLKLWYYKRNVLQLWRRKVSEEERTVLYNNIGVLVVVISCKWPCHDIKLSD